MSWRLLLFVIALQTYLLIGIAVLETTGIRAASSAARSPVAFWFALVALFCAGSVILVAWQFFVVKRAESRRQRVLLWLPVGMSVITAIRYLTSLDGRTITTIFYGAVAVTTAAVIWLSWRVWPTVGRA